ncbi:MAG: hypothetical protein ACYC9Q_14770 [Bacillota bacterium]
MPIPGEFGKAIRAVFKPFATDEGFCFRRPTLLLRENQEILHVIAFDRGLAGFACDIALQPLFIPYDFFSLGFGARVTRFRANLHERWLYGADDSDTLFRNLSQALDLVRTNALPWFAEVGSPGGLVSFIESGASVDPSYGLHCPPILREKYLAFSYLYLGRVEDAERSFRRLAEGFNGNEFAKKDEEQAREMERLVRTDPQAAMRRIQTNIKETRVNLGLDKHKGLAGSPPVTSP